MKKQTGHSFSAQYSLKEEIANSVIHGFGVLFGVGALTALLMIACLYGTMSHFSSYLVYGISLILLYTSSTLYHALPQLAAKKIFKVCDHVAIYLLIAGTYTPFLVLNLPSESRTFYVGLIWAMALVGIVFKLFFTGRFTLVSTSMYLGMGWMIVGVMEPLKQALSGPALTWLFAGGAMYTLGVVFYLMKKVPYHHGVWHLFVLLASIFHFVAILYASNLAIG